jgi:type IV secretory pathway VirB2 component (pilin)
MTRPSAFPRVALAPISAVTVALMTVPAKAAGSNRPWEQPLQQIDLLTVGSSASDNEGTANMEVMR